MYKQIFRFSLMLCFLGVSAFAQRDLATILGTVTDPQGGVIGNAKVTITEEATGVSYEVTTDQNGEFIRPLLKPGVYTVTVEATGFKKGIQKNIELTAGGRLLPSCWRSERSRKPSRSRPAPPCCRPRARLLGKT